jgi:hypothetical protein
MTMLRVRALMASAILYLCVGFTAIAVVPRVAHGQESKIGMWKLNVAKSQYPGAPPKDGTRHYEDRGCGVVLSTRRGLGADGKTYFTQYVAKTDGKEYPLAIRGSQTVNSITFTGVNDHSVAYTLRVDGKVTANGTTVVSADGNVLTVTTTPVSAERPTVEVYERQQ